MVEAEFSALTAQHTEDLNDLYHDTHGPSLTFLGSLLARRNTRAFMLSVGDSSAAACWFTRAVDEVDLVDIRVIDRFRGHGLGKTLLARSLHALRSEGVTVCHLEVRASNIVARHLYKQLGFRAVGERRNYYRVHDGTEDAILMRMDME